MKSRLVIISARAIFVVIFATTFYMEEGKHVRFKIIPVIKRTVIGTNIIV